MRHFVGVIDHIRDNRHLNGHVTYLTRAIRLNAYRQYITSYKTVTIVAMAEAFGVTPKFIDDRANSLPRVSFWPLISELFGAALGNGILH